MDINNINFFKYSNFFLVETKERYFYIYTHYAQSDLNSYHAETINYSQIDWLAQKISKSGLIAKKIDISESIRKLFVFPLLLMILRYKSDFSLVKLLN